MKLIRNEIDLRQIEIFCRIVDTGSFSKAAHSMYLSQPTVSEHVSNLESSLKLRLLDRMGRQVSLTPAGRLFYSKAQDVLKNKDDLLKEMYDFSKQAKGSLLIGASTIPGSFVLPPYITRFKKIYPDASVLLKVQDTGEVVESIKEGNYEIGIVGGRPKYPEIKYTELCKDRLILVIGPDHSLANCKSAISPQKLAELPFVIREKGSAQRDIVEKTLAKLRLRLNITCELGSNEAIRETVKQGDNAAILSYRAVESDIENGLLKTLKIKGLKFQRPLYTIYHRHKTLSPLSELFLKLLKKG